MITAFALNRIYTEYYRAQGYPFDISSSTSYDQAFVEGRDIFANISKLVEEQYNDYIVRRGHVEPMFSSYCNGTTATCRGLSQWGSYYLANQGYTPYRILQYYYGNDVDLVFNAPEGNVRASYPGRLLRRGSAGEEVRTVQKMLRRISQSFPAVPAPTVNTGVFNAATDAAVKGFQRTFGLMVDGIVGDETWSRMVAIYNSVKRLNELDSEGVSTGEAGTLYAANLRQGDIGNDVRAVQYYLDFVAQFYGSIPRVVADGIFGSATESAVKAFQQTFGLTVDGIMGRGTFNTLLNAYNQLYNSLSAGAAQNIYPDYAFSAGNTGAKVRQIQTWLSALAQRVSGLPAVTVDGVFGPGTQSAVMAFQRYAQQPISGDVGILTWNALLERYTQYFGAPVAAYDNAFS
ncbi:MAG: peptidoglycan-binding protein [Oscillospiraceae bacterium]|nr:peptidoglycan-binding protein [Oscillospiraceae bacterium]